MPRHDSSVLMLVNVLRAIILLLLISFSDLPSSVVKLQRYTYDVTCSICCPSMAIFIFGEFCFLLTTIALVLVVSKKPNSPKINIAIDGQYIEQVTSTTATLCPVTSGSYQ